MTSQTTPSFREALVDHPAEIQERARIAFKLFSDDPSHPSLQFKKVQADYENLLKRL